MSARSLPSGGPRFAHRRYPYTSLVLAVHVAECKLPALDGGPSLRVGRAGGCPGEVCADGTPAFGANSTQLPNALMNSRVVAVRATQPATGRRSCEPVALRALITPLLCASRGLIFEVLPVLMKRSARFDEGLIKVVSGEGSPCGGGCEAAYAQFMSHSVSRRALMGLFGVGAIALVTGCGREPDSSTLGADATSPTPPTAVPENVEKYGVDPALLAFTVFKDPSCGCCGGWVEHAEQNGFSIAIEHPEVLGNVFSEHDIAVDLQSCHLALNAAGTVFVGHVPVRFILEYLKNPPAGSRGLTVPAMPVGTPGMEMGEEFEPYEVLILTSGGPPEVFARVTSASQQNV